MPLYPTPHSPEWFDALARFDPQQAAHTQQIVKLSGKAEVCSICGDDPAADYKLVAANLPADAVATLRLCDDCKTMRQSTGARFQAF